MQISMESEKLEVKLLKVYQHIIIAEKFFLRPTFPEDYKAFLPLYKDKVQMQYFGTGRTFTENEVKQLIAGNAAANKWPVLNSMRAEERFFWTGINREGIGGRVCIVFKKGQSDKEIFGAIIPSQQGKGIAIEGSQAVIDYVYEKCGGSFFATVHPENERTVRVIESLGFEKYRENVPQYGTVRDYYKWEDIVKSNDEKKPWMESFC